MVRQHKKSCKKTHRCDLCKLKYCEDCAHESGYDLICTQKRCREQSKSTKLIEL